MKKQSHEKCIVREALLMYYKILIPNQVGFYESLCAFQLNQNQEAWPSLKDISEHVFYVLRLIKMLPRVL